MNHAEYIELFIKGAVVGHLVGDALGYPYEGVDNLVQYDIEMIRGSHGEPAGAWTSAGGLALATLANLAEYEDLNIDDLMEKFNDVYLGSYLMSSDECKDIGYATSEAIKNFSNGIPLDKCGDKEATDNDCLLRILPVGLYYAGQAVDKLVDNVHLVCSLTHNNATCQTVCAAYCMIVRNILLQKAEKALELLDDYYKIKQLNEHRQALAKLREYKTQTNPTGKKDIIDSFWSAWMCHARNENDYENCVVDAVHLGNDTNGTASLAGALSGLTNGLNDIPAKWLKGLRLTSEVMEISQVFINQIIQRLPAS